MTARCDHCHGSVVNLGDGIAQCIMCGREPGVRMLTPEEADAIRRTQMKNQYAGVGRK